MAWKNLTKERLLETKKQFQGDRLSQWYAMASEIILTTLGPDWWERNLYEVNRDNYFRARLHSEDDRAHHQHHVIKLGHMLFRLKELSGYDYFIKALKTADLSSTIFELEVANLLYDSKYHIKFIERSCNKGDDYDLQANILTENINVEVKTKRDGALLFEGNSLENTLRKAKKQVPRNQAGIVFIGIPLEWTLQPDTEKIINGRLESFFRNTSRIVKVVLMWKKLLPLEQGKAFVVLFKEYGNLKTNHAVAMSSIIKQQFIPSNLTFENQPFTPSFDVD